MPSIASPARRALLATGLLLAAVAPAAQAQQPTTLTIQGLSGHYHSERPIALSVQQSPDSGNDHYHWYHRCGEADDWSIFPGAKTTLNLTATPELHGCDVVVRLFGDDHAVVAESAEATIDVDDHGSGPAPRTVAIDGIAGHYQSGDPVALTATLAPSSPNRHHGWYTRCAGATGWTVVDKAREATVTLTAGPELDGCEVVTRHFNVQSAPVTVHVDDHGGPPATALSVTGLRERYAPGETIALAAAQDPQTDLDHYHWFARCGGGAWTVEPNATSATWSATAEPRHEGCEVQARLYDDDHDVVAESAPVTLRVGAPAGTEPPPAPGAGTPAAPAPAPAPAAPAGTDPTPAVAVLGARQARLATVRRTGGLRTVVRAAAPGTARVRATISRAVARRLGLGRTRTLGRATLRFTAAGERAARVELGARARKALRRARGAVRVRVTVALRTADGTVVRSSRVTTLRR